MSFVRLGFFLLLTNLSFGYSFPAFGLDDQQNSQNYQKFAKFLERVNRYTPIEGAGSHGSYGTHIGFGLNRYDSRPKAENYYYQYVMNDEQPSSSESLDLTKAYLIKGSPWPVDIGLVFGSDNSTKISQLGGHVQWTLFEGLQLPAVALRGYYSRLLGLNDTQFSSYGVDSVVSYGIFRYFNLYVGGGAQYSYMEIKVIDTEETALAQLDQSSFHKSDKLTSYTSMLGIKANIVPALLSVAGEYHRSQDQKGSLAAKLSLIF